MSIPLNLAKSLCLDTLEILTLELLNLFVNKLGYEFRQILIFIVKEDYYEVNLSGMFLSVRRISRRLYCRGS